MTLIDDDLSVSLDQGVHLALAGQRLHHGDVDLAGGFGFATANGANHALADAQERLQTLLPLLEQLSSVHQYQGVDTSPGNHRCGGNRLAKGRWRTQHPGIVGEHSGNGSLMLQNLHRDEFHGFSRVKLVLIGAFHSIVMDELPRKFPKVRFGFVEAGSLWLPYVLNDMQLRFQRRGKPFPKEILKENNLFVAVQVTDDIPYVVKHAGEDNLVIGTDYGHSDTSTQIEALRMLRESGKLEPTVVDKILDANPRRLYAL